MSKITGYLAIGNGEPCPFCGVLLDSRPDHKGEDIEKHLFENHKKEMLKKLFPKRKEAQKNICVRRPPKDKPIDRLFKKFLSEYLKNVMKILPQSYRSQQLIAGGVFAKAVLDFETKFLKEPFEEAINSLLKGKIIVNKEKAKRWDIIYDWLKENPDYKLVKKGDLLNNDEYEIIKTGLEIAEDQTKPPISSVKLILKKLKVLGGRK